MICIGFEGTAHTFGVGIINEKGDVLANVKDTYKRDEGGLIPRELAEHHAELAPQLVMRALREAGVGWGDVGVVAYSAGPGMGPALSVTAVVARMLALQFGLKLVAVNHAVAHIEIAKKETKAKDPIIVYASGGNTQVIGFDSGRYRVYGETLDIGVGNLLDAFGREIGIGFPAGPELDKNYFLKNKYIELPYSVKGMDITYSGLLTSAKKKLKSERKGDVAYSLMHNAFAMLTEVTERALSNTGKKSVLLTGGVGASKALQRMLKEMSEERGVEFNVCPFELAQDNGAMIAWTGILMYKQGKTISIKKSFTNQKFRTDQETITWL